MTAERRPQPVVDAAMGAKRGDADRQDLQVVAGRRDQRPDEAHELVGEDDHGEDDQARLDERQDDRQ